MIGEIIANAIGACIEFFVAGQLDRGLRQHFWLRLIFLVALAIAMGLAAGSLLRVLI